MTVPVPVDLQGSCPRGDACALSTELGKGREAGAAQIHQGREKIPSRSSGRTGKALGSVGILKDWLGVGGKSHPSSQDSALEMKDWGLGIWDLFVQGFLNAKLS